MPNMNPTAMTGCSGCEAGPAENKNKGQFTSSPPVLFSARNLFLVFLLFFAVAVALHFRGFNSPMFYDDTLLTDNARLFRAGDLIGVISIVPERPLFMLSFYFNYMLSGMDPYYFRLFNAGLLAAAGMALVLALTLILDLPALKVSGTTTRKRWVAGFLGLLFVAHPLQTFVVLFLWQRGALLACLFYFSALAAYLAARSGSFTRPNLGYVLTALLFLAGMLSKENVATFPAVICLAEATLFRRSFKQVVAAIVAVCVAALPIFAAYLVLTHNLHGDLSQHPLGIFNRLLTYYHGSGLSPATVMLTEGRVICSYLGMILFPFFPGVQLIRAETVSVSFWDPPGTAPAFLAICGLAVAGIWLMRRRPLTSFGILFFLVSLVPECFFIPQYLFFGYRAILPMAGVLLIAGEVALYLIDQVEKRLPGRSSTIVPAAAALICLACFGAITLVQAQRWNPLTFWKDAADRLPPYSANLETKPYLDTLSNVGVQLTRAGDHDAAIKVLSKVIEISPMLAGARNALGEAMFGAGRVQEAIALYRKEIEMKPDNSGACNNLGTALLRTGNFSEAVGFFQKAVDLDPTNVAAENNLGNAMLALNRVQDALNAYHRAVQADPGSAASHLNLGAAQLKLGRVTDAERSFETAVALRPGFAKAHANLGLLMLQTGRSEPAIKHLRRAVEIDPGLVLVYVPLGEALEATGQKRQAAATYQKALEIKPDNKEAQQHLNSLRKRIQEVEDKT